MTVSYGCSCFHFPCIPSGCQYQIGERRESRIKKYREMLKRGSVSCIHRLTPKRCALQGETLIFSRTLRLFGSSAFFYILTNIYINGIFDEVKSKRWSFIKCESVFYFIPLSLFISDYLFYSFGINFRPSFYMII